MQNFQDLLLVLKSSYICHYIIYMTLPLITSRVFRPFDDCYSCFLIVLLKHSDLIFVFFPIIAILSSLIAYK